MPRYSRKKHPNIVVPRRRVKTRRFMKGSQKARTRKRLAGRTRKARRIKRGGSRLVKKHYGGMFEPGPEPEPEPEPNQSSGGVETRYRVFVTEKTNIRSMKNKCTHLDIRDKMVIFTDITKSVESRAIHLDEVVRIELIGAPKSRTFTAPRQMKDKNGKRRIRLTCGRDVLVFYVADRCTEKNDPGEDNETETEKLYEFLISK